MISKIEVIREIFPGAREESDHSIVLPECPICRDDAHPNKSVKLYRSTDGRITGASCVRFASAGKDANREHCAPILEMLGIKRGSTESFLSSQILDGAITIEVDQISKSTQFVTIRNGIGVLHNSEIRLGKMFERAEFVKAIPEVSEEERGKISFELVQMLDRLRKVAGAVDPDGRGDVDERESAATRLIQIAESEATLIHNSDDDGFAVMMIDGHKETWPLRSKGFKKWVARKFYLEFEKSPGSQAIQDALVVLEGKSRYEGEERAIFVRIGEKDGKIYLDLADDEWRAIEIDADSWRVIPVPPVEFKRAKGMLPLPVPERGGDLETLREFMSLEKDSDLWRLMRGSLVMKFRPKGPYNIDVFTGEQGCGKTTRARVIRELVDPSRAPVRSEPREVRDLHIASSNEWLPVFDNLSRISPWLSDAFCCLSTGGGMRIRELYSDCDEAIFSTTRPLILTSITEVVERPDLLDRSVIYNLPVIEKSKRKSEKRYWSEFAKKRPGILGALLDAVSSALKNEDTVELEDPPRMADFARWAVAAESSLGMESGEFIRAYTKNLESGNDLALEAVPYSETLIQLVQDVWAKGKAGGVEGEPWTGTATDLLSEIFKKNEGQGSEGPDEQKKRKLQNEGWPKTPRTLSAELRRIAPNLRKKGIETKFNIRDGEKRTRKMSLQWNPPDEEKNSESTLFQKVGNFASVASVASVDSEATDNEQVTESKTRTQKNIAAFGGRNFASVLRPFASAEPEISDEGQEADATDAKIHPYSWVALDTETTGLTRSDRMIGISLSYNGEQADYITDPEAWALMMPDPELPTVMHNARFDLGVLGREKLPLLEKWEDTLIAAHLLDENGAHGLKELAKEHLGIEEPMKFEDADRMRLLDPKAFDEYARNDARYTFRLWQRFEPEIDRQELRQVYELEKSIVPVVIRMEDRGMLLDVANLDAMAETVNTEIERVRAEVYDYAGCVFDLNSPQKVATILYDKLGVPSGKETGKGQRSVDRETLEDVRGYHPAVDALLRFREYDKLANTFINKLPEFADPNGRIHPEFKPLGAKTGRFSCSNPNVQQIPSRSELGKKLRTTFIAGEGRKLVVADYSQMELRILAHYSQDPLLLSAYQSGAETDLHTTTAARMFGKPEDEVSKQERSIAKMINFGVAYGITPVGLFNRLKPAGIDVSEEDCERFIQDYFATYSKVRKFLADVAAAVKRRGYVKNLYGRRRRLSGESKREIRQAQNFVIQATAADIAKTAMVRIDAGLPEDACLISVIHDEMIVDCREDQAEAVCAFVVESMQMTPDGFTVPMQVEAKIGDNWGQCK